jgi:hypothetical protein
MRRTVELPDIHDIVLVFENRRLVVVDVEVIWCREYRHDRREAGCFGFPIHPVASVLSLVCTDDREQVIALQKLTSGLVSASR